MICLSGDLHHMSLGTGNQKHCDRTEIQVAAEFLKLVEAAKVKVTFFVSGRAMEEEWADLQAICRHPLVEIGGHNYTCFTPEWWHRVWKRIGGSYNGPLWYQTLDARRTLRIIEQRTGKRPRAWRNHMYMHGPWTEQALSRCGVNICSDGVQSSSTVPKRHPTGILNFPLNIIPDHEHLYHAERTPEWVDWWVKRYRWSDDFGSASYYVDEWTEIVLAQLRRNEENGVISNMILHPITMYLCDRFRSAQRILDFLSTKQTVHMSEIVSMNPQVRS